MKDDNLKQNTNTSEDIKLYGEKICNIQSRLKNILNDMLYKEYGCHRNFQSTFKLVKSNFFDCHQPDINMNQVQFAETYIEEDDCNSIINFVTAQILYEWLCKDSNAQETINDFASQYDINNPHPNLTLRAKNEEKRQENIYARAHGARLRDKKNSYYNHFTISEQNKNKDKTKPKNTSQPFNFPFIAILSLISGSDFQFLDLLQNKKDILKVAGCHKDDTIRNAFNGYLDLLNKLESDYIDNRSYVVSAMAIMDLEQALYTTLFLYFAYLIEIDKKNSSTNSNKKILDGKEQAALSFWYPFRHKNIVKCLLPDKRITVNRYFDLLRYKTLTSTLLTSHNKEDFNIIKEKNLIYRCLINDLLIIYKITEANYTTDNNAIIPFWTSNDYDYAANFFKNKYPIIKQHPLKSFNNTIIPLKNCTYNMLEIYNNLLYSECLDHLHKTRKLHEKEQEEKNKKRKSKLNTKQK